MKTTFIIFFSLLMTSAFSHTMKYDSVGVEEVNGQVFILHKVETKETLYSVSRRYNVSIYKIIESNPPTEYGLEVGQIIKIPYLKQKPAEQVTQKKEVKLEAHQPEENNVADNTYHTVVPKETLFAISRKYEVSVSDLKKWNNLKTNNLDIGQQLIVKKGTGTNDEVSTEAVVMEEKVQHGKNKTHIVQQSETLYSISRMYEVSVADIKSWNDLSTNEISIGQELIVGTGSKKQEITNTKDENIQLKEEKTSRMDSALNARNNDVNDHVKERETKTMEASSEFGEVIESGVAALIDGSDNTRKYLALHRTAKVGTIMRVHNEMNGQEVFVRVLGKLPDTGVNKNVVIRISKSAYDRLGAIDPKFRVKLSYIP